MAEGRIIHKTLPSDPVVIDENPQRPVPFLTRFATEPQIKAPPDIQMGNQTYLGSTPEPYEHGDFIDDDK